MVNQALVFFRTLLRREPARLLSGVAAVLTVAASLFEQLGIDTWQGALPVLLGEAVRRLVYAPSTVEGD